MTTKTSHKEIIEYIYKDERQRAEHVKFMTLNGWEVGSRVRILDPEFGLQHATEKDYIWYAYFHRSKV